MPTFSQNVAAAKSEFRGLPANLDAERLILGTILLNEEVYAVVAAALARADFSLEKHRRIFARMADLAGRGEHIDRLTLAEELQKRGQLDSVDGLGYLVSLDDGLPEVPNLDSYIRIVKDKALLRRIIRSAHMLADRAYEGVDDADAIVHDGAGIFGDFQREIAPQDDFQMTTPWPEPIAAAGYYGIAGDLVRVIEPETESDPAGLLAQFIVGWGSLIGRGPYYLAEADRHHTNEFVAVVGVSSKARKGTGWGRVGEVLAMVDEHWSEECRIGGVGSGEALIDALNAENGDRRVLVTEPEFARLLAVIAREGSTLSSIFRTGWDSGTAAIRTRQKKVKVSGAHLSMIAHITKDELLKRLADVELVNGFTNRILPVCVARTKELPLGGGLVNYGDIPERLKKATDFARRMGVTRVQFDAEARVLWIQVYSELSRGKLGLLGAATARAEAHVVRLSLIYALLDCSREIRIEHLQAALAFWKYSENSARYIWGDAIGDATADQILAKLRTTAEGMTLTDLNNLFARNKDKAEIQRALGVLVERGLLGSEKGDGVFGRPSIRYFTRERVSSFTS